MKKIIRNIIAVLLTVILLYILLTQIKIEDIFKVIFSISFKFLILGFILYFLSYIFRMLRFFFLLNRKIKIKKLFDIVCVHNLFNQLLPAKTGELSYIYLIRRTDDGIATLFLARIFDLFMILFIFLISMIFVNNIFGMDLVWISLLLLIIVLIIFIGVIFFGKDIIFLFKFSNKLYNWLNDLIIKINIIKDKKVFYLTFIYTILIWLSMYLFYYVIAIGFGLNMTIWQILFCSGFLLLVSILPVQGIVGFGSMEGAWALAFISLGFSKEIAISTGFGLHIIQICFFFILGIYGLVSLRKKKD